MPAMPYHICVDIVTLINVTKIENNASKSLNRIAMPYHICVDIVTLINVSTVDNNASKSLNRTTTPYHITKRFLLGIHKPTTNHGECMTSGNHEMLSQFFYCCMYLAGDVDRFDLFANGKLFITIHTN